MKKMNINEKIIRACLLLFSVCSMNLAKAQSIVKADSLKLLQEKYSHSVKFTYGEGHDSKAFTTLKLKNFSEFEELLKKEVQRVERRKIKLDSLKKYAPYGSWVL